MQIQRTAQNDHFVYAYSHDPNGIACIPDLLLEIIYSIAWSLEEVVTELVVPMVLICVILNIAISIFGEVVCSLVILILTVCLHFQFRCVH